MIGGRVTPSASPNPMDESRKMSIEILRERLEREEYHVDPEKVADAIVERLLAGRSVREAADVLAAEARRQHP